MKIKYLVLALTLAFVNYSCSLFYVAKQGVYQMKLLAGAEPIELALRRINLPKEPRAKLILISKVREFSQKNLKLVADKNYKNVNLSWHNIIHNVSASEKLAFKPYLWWFPIIGAVPYKGYFDEKDAQAEIKRLKSLGLDTLKRRVGGYSTLGYFSDPVWPTMLEMRDEALAELIIHELAHATVYIANQTPFNETFANFVGKTGARMFYVDKFGENSEEVRRLDKFYQHEKEYNKFFSDLYVKLDNIYKKNISQDEKKSAQQKILLDAQARYELTPISKEFIIADWSRINNAYLLAFKAYNYDEAVFADLFKLVNYDFKRFLAEVAAHSQGPDPFLSLRQYINNTGTYEL
jgi:predicted aminopeptidase